MPAGVTALFAVVVVGYVLVSRRVGLAHLTAPIVFTAIGYLAARVVAEASVDPSFVRAVAEVTLAIVLFHDAAQVRPAQLRGDVGLCLRLLLVGLPLTILLGVGVGSLLLPGVGFALVLLLASALAPTDAGLGAATVLNKVVPVRVRRVLNVESGLNDGLATPVVLFAISAVGITAGEEESALVAALEELAIGVVLGVGLGALCGALLARAYVRGWAEGTLVPVATAVVPLLTYYGAVMVGGNGFVSAFVSGTAFAWALHRTRVQDSDALDDEQVLQLAEWVSVLIGYLVWTLFGFAALGSLSAVLTWQAVLFAVLSLTVLRMLPVALSLLGTGLRPPTLLFVGWFGPRGLASVVFSVIAVESLPMTPELQLVLATIVLTVVMSVVLHGVTAGPWAATYGAWAGRTRPPVETAGSVEPGHGRSGITPSAAPRTGS